MRDFLEPLGIGMAAALWIGAIVLSLRMDRPEMAVLALCAFIVTMIGGFVWARIAGARDADQQRFILGD